MRQSVHAALLPLLAVALGAASASAENKKFDRAEAATKLKTLFPHGHREGREGVMKLGGNFRTVVRRTWEQCRDLCQQLPSDGVLGCAVWTFVKADDPKMPNVCRMWVTPPEMRENPAAVSGPGQFK
jgi:urease accessory protein UreF